MLIVCLIVSVNLDETRRLKGIVEAFPFKIEEGSARTMIIWKDLLVVGTGGHTIRLFKKVEEKEKATYIQVAQGRIDSLRLVDCLQLWQPVHEGKLSFEKM